MNYAAELHTLQAYLFFNGRCEEAVAFYAQALGAKVTALHRFSESPEPLPPGRLPAGFETRIMHAALRIGRLELLLSDGCDAGPAQFNGFSLSLSVPTEAEAQRTFTALAEGGQVTMPLTRTFWSPCFGMLTDRFGVGWMINLETVATPFTISRVLRAPRERVWQAWTEKTSLAGWFRPPGMNLAAANIDVRPGGRLHYCLRAEDGSEMWGRFSYHEVEPPGRLVWVGSHSDAGGGITRHEMNGAPWPLELLASATLTAVPEGTLLDLRWHPVHATEGEQATFTAAHDLMRAGWSGMLDQLEAHLAST